MSTKLWSERDWEAIELRLRRAALDQPSDREAWLTVAAQANRVVRHFSSSFYVVTRFLPLEKRRHVEVIYAAVRYPDEIVDTFPLDPASRLDRLVRWERGYRTALEGSGMRATMSAGAPCFAAAFAETLRQHGIPSDLYLAFLDAMRRDVHPRPFETLADLIDEYVYGSAIVVGYFLAHVYGARRPSDFDRALECSKDLGIALQLTNFARDVTEDARRGRLYLPLDRLREEGLGNPDPGNPAQEAALRRIVRSLAEDADAFYSRSRAGLDAFAPDCRTAIDSCIRVYRELNTRIRRTNQELRERQRLSTYRKFRLLPLSKYWRLPLAFLER